MRRIGSLAQFEVSGVRVKSEDEVRALTFFALLYIGVSAISRPFSVIRHDQLVNKRQSTLWFLEVNAQPSLRFSVNSVYYCLMSIFACLSSIVPLFSCEHVS